MPRPVFNNVTTLVQLPDSGHPTTSTTTKCSDNPPADSGMDILGLLLLFNTPQQVTLPNNSFRPLHISTPCPGGLLRYPQTPQSPNHKHMI